MLTDEALETLAADLESDRVERERLLSETPEAFDDVFARREKARTSQPARREVADARLSDLDLAFFHERYLPRAVATKLLSEINREAVEQLASLHLVSTNGRPTFGALLLLGHDPRRFLPGAYVQYVRFDGYDRLAPILDQKELGGSMPRLLPTLDHLTSLNIKIATEIGEHTVERRSPDYPLAAIQQLLRNAVLHRSYEINAPVYWFWFRDHLEIHSPGGPFGRVTESNFLSGVTDYRNPTLAQGLKVLGFVQRFGIGIQLAAQRCAENGNPPPEFEISPHAVIVRIRQRPA